MTTPSFVMPYGHTVGGAKDMHWLTSVTGTSANVDLPEGPCRVVASWAGPEQADLVLLHSNGGKSTLDTIEKKAGGVSHFSDGHSGRYQGRPSAPRGFASHYNGRYRHYRGLPHPVRLTSGAVV